MRSWRFVSSFSGRAEQTGLLYAAGVAATTFQRGLLPRSTRDQAIVTGSTATIAYGVGVTLQAAIDALARRWAGTNGDSHAQLERRISVVSGVTAMAVGVATQAAFREVGNERFPRAVVRTVGRGLTATAGCGTAVSLAESVLDREGGDGRGPQLPVALPLGAAMAGGMYYFVQRREQRAKANEEVRRQGETGVEAPAISARRAATMSVGITALLGTVAVIERVSAHGIGRGLSWATGASRSPADALGHVATLTLMGAGLVTAYQRVLASQEQGADAIEAAYSAAPESPFVSGGPRSLIAWEPLSREGRRFVGMALDREEIERVVGEPAKADPLRLYAGLESAPDPVSRVDLLLDELIHMGAYERSTICLFAPTGSGYVNYVAVEALEYLTRGDVASVCLQYSKRPSFMSLDRVSIGRHQLRDLLRALSTRIELMPPDKRPRLLIFGESLGAHVSQDCFLHRGAGGLEAFGIDAAVWLGTPHASQWRHQVFDDGEPPAEVVEVSGAAELAALDADRVEQLRYLLLTHVEDPIPKFTPRLAVQKPDWLGPAEERPTGLPTETIWTPFGTFMTIGVDLLNAMNIQPGHFNAFAHDYRSDIRPAIQAAFGLPASIDQQERIDQALRARESRWARERVIADEMARANEAIRQRLGQFGEAVSIPVEQDSR